MSIVDIITSLVGVSGAVFGFTQWLITRHDKKVTITRTEFDAFKDVIMELAYMRLKDRYNTYKDRGWVTIDEQRVYENLYDAYHTLGGNGVGTNMFKKVMALPIAPPETIYSNNKHERPQP